MSPATASATPAWSTRLIDQLGHSDQKARELYSGLSPDQLNWQPDPTRWSMGQCLEHLAITDEAYLPAISNSLAGHPASAVPDIGPGWFGRWFIRSFIRSFIEPSPQTKRARAPKKIAPGSSVEPSVLDRFLRSNQAARELIRRAQGYDVNRIRFKNPFLPMIRFTAGTGLVIICGHERRHLLQAERVFQSPGFPR